MRKVFAALAVLSFIGGIAAVITVAYLGGRYDVKPVEIAAAIACAITCAFMTMGASLGAMAFRPAGAEPPRQAPQQAAPYAGQHSGPVPQPQHPGQQQWPGHS
ncbi:MAG TPA: hypothetical protein VM677_20390 [Actinokineospora sp.]|nr:hypothetical protein [Actinokineospora sp.]